VGIHGAGHGDGAAVIGKTVVGFVLDGGAGGLLVHAGAKAAALDHEAGDHAMENGVGIKAVIHILQEVGDGVGSLVGEELDQDVARGRFQQHGGIGHGNSLREICGGRATRRPSVSIRQAAGKDNAPLSAPAG